MDDAFNDNFLSIPYKTVANVTRTVPDIMDKLYDWATLSLEILPVDVESMSFLVSSLHIQKASDADGLSAQFIRASPYVVRLVTVLINGCIESCLVPFQWKQTIVTPVPKCKQCTSLTHFWPISVLPTVSETLEHLCIIKFSHMLPDINYFVSINPDFVQATLHKMWYCM